MVSSAYMSVLDKSIYNGRSLINRRKSSGPKIEPCGTPLIMTLSSDKVLFKDTFCFLSFKYDWNHDMVLFVNF